MNYFHEKQKVAEALLQSLRSLHWDLEVRKTSPTEAGEDEFYDKKSLEGSTT